MITKGRIPNGRSHEFVTGFLPRNRGIRIDDPEVPDFWLEILFDPDDFNKIRGDTVYLVEAGTTDTSEIIFSSIRLASAKRFLRNQLDHSQWKILPVTDGKIVLCFTYGDNFICIKKQKLSP
jgi:hypothetical protein